MALIQGSFGSGIAGPQGPIGPQGPSGPAGPAGLEWRGAWSSSTAYIPDDAVGYNGASYFCIKTNTNSAPTELPTDANWALLASHGATGPQGPQGIQGPSGITAVRQKSEVTFTGLNLVIPTTATNLIALIKTLTHTGSLTPFFNTTTNKFNVYNNSSTVTFKMNIIGAFSDSDITRSMEIDFTGTVGNKLVESRDSAVTSDTLSFATFFSVDAGGNLATNGAPITIKSNGRSFTANTILLIAEQMVPSS